MKKILFTATVDSHILQFHLPYLKLFKENGYEVHVATNGNEEIPYCDKKYLIPFERSPFKINNIKAINKLKKIIENEKYDIIHTHTPMGSVVTRISAKKARKKYNTRVIYTAHGFHFFKGASFKNWILYYPVEKLLSFITDDIITINLEDYNFAKENLNSKNVYYVPGVGVNRERFDFILSDEEKEKTRNKLNISLNDFVIIYTAEISNRKNQYMLIRVLKNIVNDGFKNIKVLLPGIDSLNGKIQKMVNDYNLNDYVIFTGYRKDIPTLFSISNLSVSCSKQEGLPVNIIEAGMSKKAVIATDCRGNRDLIKNGENGYIVKIDADDDMAKKIEELIKDNKKLYKMGEKNYNIMQKYELSNIVEEMKKIYNI